MKIQTGQWIRIMAAAGLCVLWAGCGGGANNNSGSNVKVKNDIDSSLYGEYWLMYKDPVSDKLSALEHSSQYKMEVNADGLSLQGASFPMDRSVVIAKGGQIWSVSTDNSSAKVYMYDYQFDANNSNLLLITVDSSSTFVAPSKAAAEPWSYCRDGADCSTGDTTSTTNLAAPSNLTAKYISEGIIRLQWIDNSTDEQGFRIERKADNESTFIQLAVVPVGSILYDDVTVSANNSYAYRVIAVRAAGDTGPSNVAAVSTWPPVLRDLVAEQIDVDAMKLTWTDTSDLVTGYRVEQAADAVNFETIATLPESATAFTATALAMGSSYTWKIIVVEDWRESSAQITATVVPSSGPKWQLPDTGQSLCYGASSAITCPTAGTAYFGQDAQYGTNVLVYTDNGDGTITDNVTNLIWQKQDDGTRRTWQAALSYCANLTLGSYSDWRLPDRYELQSIVDNGTYSPSIDATYFPGTASDGGYWSSSYAVYTNYAWGVGFNNGFVGVNEKTVYSFARCVRP